jgi:spore coat protein U-like protein
MTALRIRKLRHAAQVALALTCTIAAFEASAAYSCTISVTAITTVYSPSVQNDNTGSFTMNCTRLATDANTMNYTVRANNGLQPTGGGQRRVQRGATTDRYNYNLYRDAGFSQAWGATVGTDFDQGTNPFNFGTSLTASQTVPFYLRLPVDASPGAAGNYTDTVTVTLNPQGGGNTVTASLFVTAITTNSCQITVSPGNVSFTYTSFQAGPAAASSVYGVRCTAGFPYNMALDATSGTLLGLNYTLSVPAGSTGTGLTQSHTINGSIAAGQAGTCATGVCSGSQIRTLTISW